MTKSSQSGVDAVDQIIWKPSEGRIASANMTAFISMTDRRWHHGAKTYAELHAWSVRRPEEFWQSVIDFHQLKALTWGARPLVDKDLMPGARFFPDARLNFAENLLGGHEHDDSTALIFWGEDRTRRHVTWRQLAVDVHKLAWALKNCGVTSGDRVAGYLPNMPEAIIAMLATTSLGAVWSSCSPDFGVEGVVDRFGQIEPKVLFAVDNYTYNGKTHDCLPKIREIRSRIPSLMQVVVVDSWVGGPSGQINDIKNGVLWDEFIATGRDTCIEFAHMPFDAPVYVMFSSGTTGAPKCIVHGAGGTLLKQVSELGLHCDVKPNDRLFYFTTCSWMMWNWLAAGLALGATLLLYDGSPTYPDANILFDFAEREGATLFGTSAKFIDTLRQGRVTPIASHKLGALRTITSTGSPLSPESFDYVYKAIHPNCHLASISGGTDILGCFVIGSPLEPVRRGEIQVAALGMAVDVYSDDGLPVREEKGELVCTKPFPSMPVSFWSDPGNQKYLATYFQAFPGLWHHGDFAEITRSGGFVIYGRSDTTLNPGGVRIGTAEIYRQIEKMSFIKDSVVVGQDVGNDVRVVLFVVLEDGINLTSELTARISSEIRKSCTARHVPAVIVAIDDVPRTKSGKITEAAVRDVIHGRAVKNTHALANPEALDAIRSIASSKLRP